MEPESSVPGSEGSFTGLHPEQMKAIHALLSEVQLK
jgi:hypothetical protein